MARSSILLGYTMAMVVYCPKHESRVVLIMVYCKEKAKNSKGFDRQESGFCQEHMVDRFGAIIFQKGSKHGIQTTEKQWFFGNKCNLINTWWAPTKTQQSTSIPSLSGTPKIMVPFEWCWGVSQFTKPQSHVFPAWTPSALWPTVPRGRNRLNMQKG